MDMKDYQKRALATSKFGEESNPRSAVAPMLGLAGATGAILDLYKKYFNDQLKLVDQQAYLREELGDLLWYLAVLAKTVNLDLDEIAASNLNKAADRYGQPTAAIPPQFAGHDTPRERFPRRVVVEFREYEENGLKKARLTLSEADPNDFEAGSVEIDELDENGMKKRIGYKVGAHLGAPLDDNSRRDDNYRYHDAIHLGFMAVTGWSPISRELFGIKRRSTPEVNRIEDGARAKFLEEGMAAVLQRLSVRRANFGDERMIDGEVLTVVEALVSDLEVKGTPGWLWRRAIHQGFTALHRLGEERGGFLVADLDSQTLRYEK